MTRFDRTLRRHRNSSGTDCVRRASPKRALAGSRRANGLMIQLVQSTAAARARAN
ncbi:hypothetical protein PP715_18855 [Ralstonia solanacearum]|uniref:hypothetical protein n=1 Tax=Ralstonia solanacearum TaxID=305 RepID=UPI000ADCC429|nr:hypothetical protein [Ralstonia solanacearum]MCL9841492.1 hypothetical protein [Ralstonia solanacearum]MDC6189005.1 hypothetical protein [Ralstonia solanacearum]MDC6264689.1 hypothetical protein [Ralstonia solanacearum]MDC6319677.1 hypothetical protein [Ralstonia solanacearum]